MTQWEVTVAELLSGAKIGSSKNDFSEFYRSAEKYFLKRKDFSVFEQPLISGKG